MFKRLLININIRATHQIYLPIIFDKLVLLMSLLSLREIIKNIDLLFRKKEIICKYSVDHIFKSPPEGTSSLGAFFFMNYIEIKSKQCSAYLRCLIQNLDK